MLEPIIIGLLMAFSYSGVGENEKPGKLMRLQGREIHKHVKELEQRNEELQKVNQEKVQIISLVSHDLKGPRYWRRSGKKIVSAFSTAVGKAYWRRKFHRSWTFHSENNR